MIIFQQAKPKVIKRIKINNTVAISYHSTNLGCGKPRWKHLASYDTVPITPGLYILSQTVVH